MQNIMDFILGRKRDRVSMLIEEALAMMGEGEYAEAIALIEEKILAKDPDHPRANLHLGLAYMLKGDKETARSILRPFAERPYLDSDTAMAKIAMDKMDGKG